MEVVRWRRRTGFPLETRGLPGIRASDLAELQRPDEINRRQNEADCQDGSSGAGENVEHLEFRRIRSVAARHPQVPEDELGEERQVEPDEYNQRRKFGPGFGIHAARHLGPPEM